MLDDPAVAGALVIVLQAKEHDHVRPEVFFADQVRRDAGPALAGPKPTVGLLTGQCRLDPAVALRDHGPIVERVTAIQVTLEPVRHLFPAGATLAFARQPGVALRFEKAA